MKSLFTIRYYLYTYSCGNSLPTCMQTQATKFCNSASSDKAGFINFRKLEEDEIAKYHPGVRVFFLGGGEGEEYERCIHHLQKLFEVSAMLETFCQSLSTSITYLVAHKTAHVCEQQQLQCHNYYSFWFGKLCGMISNYMYMCRLFNDWHNNVRTVVYTIKAYN